MSKTLYEILNRKAKNSILKSYTVSSFNDSHANVRIEVEAYDDTYLNAMEKKGLDYVYKVLENALTKEKTQKAIAEALGLEVIQGFLVTVYSAPRHSEMYFTAEGKNQYGIEF